MTRANNNTFLNHKVLVLRSRTIKWREWYKLSDNQRVQRRVQPPQLSTVRQDVPAIVTTCIHSYFLEENNGLERLLAATAQDNDRLRDEMHLQRIITRRAVDTAERLDQRLQVLEFDNQRLRAYIQAYDRTREFNDWNARMDMLEGQLWGTDDETETDVDTVVDVSDDE